MADPSPIGLRERKKAKTRTAIQQHALRLFREQGYDATTIEQIAEAAEISPSTFFRYFPTKEDVVLQDDFDDVIVGAFRAQPPELSPLQALRRAMSAAFNEFPNHEIKERTALIRAVPELRAKLLDEFQRTIQLLAVVMAERVGRPADDFAVRTLAGAIIGVGLAAMLAVDDEPAANYLTLMDKGMALLEAGLPL